MDFGLVDKNVLVVGGSKGIGRATALAFAKEGSRVTVVARSEEHLHSVVSEMDQIRSGHAFRRADLLDGEKPREVAAALIDGRGPFDVVVHSIGGPLDFRDPLAPREQWETVWRYNCGIAIEMNEALIPPMVQRRWGRVIHISSISAITLRGAPAYAASKAYLNAYTKTIGRALAPDGVVVSAIMPGAVAFEGSYWDKFVKQRHPRVDDYLRHHQAIGRMGTVDEIACFAVMLGSEKASFEQAALVPVDGGSM